MPDIPDQIVPKKTKLLAYASVGILALFVVMAAVTIASIAPSGFPGNATVSIKPGQTIAQTADQLKAAGIIRSAFVYEAYIRLINAGHGVKAGDYYFKAPESAIRVAYRTAYSQQDLPVIKVVLPEGLASFDMAKILAADIPGFDGTAFAEEAKPYEGYLFPDTYFFDMDTTPSYAIASMRTNFDKRTAVLNGRLASSSQSFSDIVKVASIVEKEATSSADRKIVAGILWKRLAAGMPLQVDPPFYYILGKVSSELSPADLKIDSPYNLYLNKGLPPTAIDNPGLGAIDDTLDSVSTEYWFYISGKDGSMHYASTYQGHLANIAKYL
jgi:UPF0755 protein